MDKSVLMLYYIVFYEMTHRPSIFEFYIIDILFLSFSHPSIHIFFSISLHNLESDLFFFCLFYAKQISVATMI